MQKPQRTYERITHVLRDGTWHELDDLRDVTSFPEEWISELRAEGVLETAEQSGNVLVRLAAPAGDELD